MFRQIGAGNVGLSILVGGQEAREYDHATGRFVEAVLGAEFMLCLQNNSPVDIEVVASVDGRSILTDGAADWATQRGYIVSAYGACRIPGFKVAGREGTAAAFTFVASGQSYAARVGQSANVGVIGAAVFTRRERPVRIAKSPHLESFGENTRRLRSTSAGTGFGRPVDFQTHSVAFERASTTPVALLALRYETRERLVEMGLIILQMVE